MSGAPIGMQRTRLSDPGTGSNDCDGPHRLPAHASPASGTCETHPRSLNSNRPCLVGPPAPWQEAQGLLGDTQAAFKLLMETAREREAAVEGLEGQLEAAKGLVESLRRARDEAMADSQARLFLLFLGMPYRCRQRGDGCMQAW